MNHHVFSTTMLAVMLALLPVSEGCAHGFAGKRFFPATIQTDDPFVADELSLPTVSTFQNPASDDTSKTRETDVGVSIAKRITPNFGIELVDTHQRLVPEGDVAQKGFGNLEATLKYQLVTDAARETIFSFGLSSEIGRTGSKAIGSDSFSTFTPTLWYGKGFGDMFDDRPMLKPFAFTGVIGVSFPSSSGTTNDAGDIERHPHVLRTDFAIEYSLPYLQSFVKDMGLTAPFNRLIPVVEFAFQTPIDRGQRGQTTGTINPGVIWAGQHFQLAAEAIIPANARTGHDVGAVIQLHFFLDDLFPNSIGKPIFRQ
jgi:hypothetical protein